MRSDELITLWQAVVMQIITDVRTPRKSDEGVEARRQGIKWIFNKEFEEDYFLVCEYAQFSPEFIRDGMRRVLDSQ